ncbi:MAG: DNA ligase [Psychrobium sp.]|nr:DNA ligase [Psychrobium sp.]
MRWLIIPLTLLFWLSYSFLEPTHSVAAQYLHPSDDAPIALEKQAKPNIELANRYHKNIDINDYWISEKLDGVRAFWNGKQLISKQGNVFHAPDWFIKDFGKTPLDGELWISRNNFSDVSGIVRQKRLNNVLWRQVKFMIFDLPHSTQPFSQRIDMMKAIVKKSPSEYLKMITQKKLSSKSALQTWLDKVVTQGGEGLMLHKGSAFYEAKRSDNILKLKKVYDAQATVIEHIAGKGKFTGLMGAMRVKTSQGVEFKIGSGFTMQQRINPPPIGSTITYKYYGTTKNGVPRFASFLRLKKQ